MDPRPSFKSRLRAWWEGYELDLTPPPEKEADEVLPVLDDTDDEPPTVSHWPQGRIVAAQNVFGVGFLGPLAEQAMLEYTKPFGLTEKESSVHLGAGLGGAARTLAREYSTWVDAYEPDAELAEAGAEMSVAAGLASRAKLVCSELEKADVRKGSKDAVICTEVLYRVADKAALIKKIAKMLKPGGQVLLIECVTGDDVAEVERPEGWPEDDLVPANLAGAEEITEIMKKEDFTVSVTQDITEDYHRMVRDAFAAYEESIKGRVFDERLREWVVNEGEMWMSRIAAMEAGAIKVYRFFGRKK